MLFTRYNNRFNNKNNNGNINTIAWLFPLFRMRKVFIATTFIVNCDDVVAHSSACQTVIIVFRLFGVRVLVVIANHWNEA